MLLSDDLDIVVIVDIHDLIVSMGLIYNYRYSTCDEYMGTMIVVVLSLDTIHHSILILIRGFEFIL